MSESEKHDSAHKDHQSDPARTPGFGWVGEGGASHLGPATHTRPWPAGNVEPEGDAAEADADVDDAVDGAGAEEEQ